MDKKKRAKVYSELYEFNEQLLLNLKYGKVRLETVTSQFKYVQDVLDGKYVLGGDDGEILTAYARCIGTTDPISQIDYLNERKIILKKMRDESAENYKKYSSLYVKIALMIGILIAVILA
ncbi:MAG: hypothetical protein ACI4L9_04065 [Candidatus Coproplasma sp.]